MKKLNIKNFLVFLILVAASVVPIWKGGTTLKQGYKNESVTEDWKIELPSNFALANKHPDGSYFFPSKLSLNRPVNEVTFKDLKPFIGVSTENSITVLNDPTVQIHYILRANDTYYHAVVSPTYSVKGFDLDQKMGVFKDNITINCSYHLSDTENNKRMAFGCALLFFGVALAAFGFRAISTRVEKVLSKADKKKE